MMKLGPISLLFWPKISTSLWDPLGCSDLSQIFFGSSPVATNLDKTVAEIIHTTFVFLGHPTIIARIYFFDIQCVSNHFCKKYLNVGTYIAIYTCNNPYCCGSIDKVFVSEL